MCIIQVVLFMTTNIIKSTTYNVNSTSWIISIIATMVIQSLQYCKFQDYNVSATFQSLEILGKSPQFSF